MTSTASTASTSGTDRLPRSVVPRRYRIEVEPDLVAQSFRGELEVEVEVTEVVTEVVLNAAGLDIELPELAGRPASVALGPGREQVTLRSGTALAPGPATLRLRFSGRLGDDMQGFYLSRFPGPGGTEARIAATDFEPTSARRAFPCWDEPDLKATFTLSVIVPAGSTVLSSGPEEAVEHLADGRERVRFGETIPMSTYVLAWVVGPFEATEPVEVDGVPVRVAVPAGRLPLAGFALGAATHALGWLAGYFSVPFPTSKIDHVAIPDFASGAMENLGCVTYRESMLLADPASSSQAELREIVETVAHETAHMWFGDLATMRWWNGLWLNEAFATFLERKAADAFHPDWDAWSAAAPARAEALAVDGLASTRPVEHPVVAPADAEDMFDVLTYQKGAGVLRMLEEHLGEDDFRRGVTRYLTDHAFANTETTDLWDALESASGQPVRGTMEAWISSPGHPVVTASRGEDPATVELTQARFAYRGAPPGSWRVPLVLRASVAGEVVERRVLLDEPATVRFDAPVEWLVVNGGGHGFHRSTTEASLRPPDLAVLTPLERVVLVDDAWAVVLAGGSVESFADLARRLGAETHPDVWAVAARCLGMLERVAGDDERAAVADLVRDAARPGWGRVGWEPRPGEPEIESRARSTLLRLLGTVGADPEVRAGATERWEAHRRGRAALDPEAAPSVLAVVASAGGPAELDGLLEGMRTAASPLERERHLHALAGFEGRDEVRAVLGLICSGEVRPQDWPALIARVLAGRQGATLGWPWVEEHAPALEAALPAQLLLDALSGVSSIVDAEAAGRVHRWFAQHPLPTGGRPVAQLEERMDLAVALARRCQGRLARSLRVGAPSGGGEI